VISPEDLMARLGVLTQLYAADEEFVFGVLNDKESGLFFSIGRATGNILWRVESPAGWVLSSPLLWGEICIAGTSMADVIRRGEDGDCSTVSWRRGGAVIAFGVEDGKLRFLDKHCGTVRETPFVEGNVLLVQGEIRTGGFRNHEPWMNSTEVESRFALPSGNLISRRPCGDLDPVEIID